MQQWACPARRTGLACFNPHPPVGAGATPTRASSASSPSSGFNPHPPVGAGATRKGLRLAHATPRFQSSPARGGGCNVSSLPILYHIADGFQSSPARGGGCNGIQPTHIIPHRGLVSILTRPWGRVQRASIGIASWRLCRFNPHPPVGAGATYPNRCLAPLTVVSILTRPWGRVQQDDRRD